MYDIYGNAKITGNYGDKRSYYKPGKFHEGDDIALPMNSPINAVSSGTVIKVANDPKGYGNYVDIDHGNGYVTRYAHANDFNVKVGDKINEGQTIGRVGSTGRSTGAHLHFETIKDGKKVNPRNLKDYFISDTTIKPKGIKIMANEGQMAGAAANIEDLKNQIAQNQARQRIELTPEEQALKELTIKSIMGKLETPIAQPRYLTIQDMFKKNLDDSNIVPYFNPEMQRGINDLFGTKVYNPKTGQVEDLAEDYPRRIEAQMQGEKAKALEEEKMQNALNANAYNSLNRLEEGNAENELRRDIALQDLLWNKERFDFEKQAAEERRAWEKEKLDRAEKLERDKLAAQYGVTFNDDGSINAAPENNSPSNIMKKMSAADKNSYTENKATLANIEAGLKSLDENKGAYSYIKGLLGADITNRLDPKGVATRTQIDNITAVYRTWLTGAQMSDKERKAYERFLPAPTDNYTIVKAKLEGMKGAIERSNQALLSTYGITDSDMSETITPNSVTVQAVSDTVKVKSPDGKIGTIPRANLEKAKAKGYTEI